MWHQTQTCADALQIILVNHFKSGWNYVDVLESNQRLETIQNFPYTSFISCTFVMAFVHANGAITFITLLSISATQSSCPTKVWAFSMLLVTLTPTSFPYISCWKFKYPILRCPHFICKSYKIPVFTQIFQWSLPGQRSAVPFLFQWQFCILL